MSQAALISLIALLFALPTGAAVRLSGELGWQGWAVLGAVNPLWVTVENAGEKPLTGELLVHQQIGSAWRGQAARTLQVPIALGPFGRARLLLPWALEPGERGLSLVVQVAGEEVGEGFVPVRLAPEGLQLLVGPPPRPPPSGVLLSPEELPEDPLFLSPFSTLYRDPATLLPPRAEVALAAWMGFLGGPGPPPAPEVLLQEHPPPLPLGPLALALALYLLLLGFALPPLGRSGHPAPLLALLLPTLGLSLFYPVFYEVGETNMTMILGLSRYDTPGFCLEWAGIAPWRMGKWRGEGLWIEALPTGGDWGGRDLSWEFGPDGTYTVIPLHPGQERWLWRLGPPPQAAGEEFEFQMQGEEVVRERDGQRFPLSEVPGELDPAFRPLWEAVAPELSEGDRLILATETTRQGEKLHRYYLSWERHGN
jgi:hypothetical protein